MVHPGSACPQCQQPIHWFDNLPVVSWFVLMGKCRACKAPFSFRYAATELFVGLFAVALVYRFGLTPFALTSFLAGAIMIVIAGIDHDTWLIDDRMTLALAAAAIGVQMARSHELGEELWRGPLWALAGGLGALAMLWLIGWVTSSILGTEAMGGGDAPLFGAITILLGPAAIPLMLILTGVQGMLAWLVMRGRGGVGDHDVTHEDGWTPSENAMPMGIFLVLAALELQVAGEPVIDGYLDFLRALI